MPGDSYEALPDPDKAYPVVRMLVKHGNALAVASGAGIALAGIGCAVAGLGWAWLPAGLAVGGFVGLLMRSYVELVRLITDMLLPR